jgi:type IV pilus assembly protein PilP
MFKKLDITICVFVISAVAFFSGCKGENKTESKPAPKPKAAAEQAAPAVAEEKIEKEVYVYDARGRRDPFKSLVAVAKEKPHFKKKANPLENYDVDEIKLAAIVWDNRQYYALITLPDNKSYTIRKGMALGLYSGKVQDITKDSVLIREEVKDYRGQPRTKDTLLKLRKEGVE